MKNSESPREWQKPTVTFDREGDRVVSAYIELRAGKKAAGCVRPHPDALVFCYVAADGLPIGIRLHEAISGVAVCELLARVFPSHARADELGAVLRALREALVDLERHSESGALPS